MLNLRTTRFIRFLYKDADRYALTDIEDIFVFSTLWRAFFLVRITVQIQKVEAVKRSHEALSHPSKSRVFEVTVVGYKGQYCLISLLTASCV
jgi:hypothetical protein